MPIKIVDLFAGPGGLGEGFSSYLDGKAFRIIVSAEMEKSAHATLRLRSFFRAIQGNQRDLAGYYDFCNGTSSTPWNARSERAWEKAGLEARQLTLGKPEDDQVLDEVLDQQLAASDRWVLIGGPPCQAYSIVGRARNVGTANYRAEEDHRHFLYRQYLRIIKDRRPPVFVMENVKGILSSRVGGRRIFHDILRDLSEPDGVFEFRSDRPGYRIHSLVTDTFFEKGMDPESIDPADFIVESEKFGIPQARHRVILLGIRKDVASEFNHLVPRPEVTVRDVIADLPALRSRLSSTGETASQWAVEVRTHLLELSEDAAVKNISPIDVALRRSAGRVRSRLPSGGVRLPREDSTKPPPHSADWYLDPELKVWLNHESRRHMSADLRRYGYAATYAAIHGHSPKGTVGFPLVGLAPNHENWGSGKFTDRFRVQRYDAPASTVTSHIAKDGNYFIHPDPSQCRTLTVREAARLQTFPDNYFFQGNRTEQYHQVGNAVPPLLATMIAGIVRQVLR
jgi:DNA (cytosine-5)-methyltransferase 1